MPSSNLKKRARSEDLLLQLLKFVETNPDFEIKEKK